MRIKERRKNDADPQWEIANTEKCASAAPIHGQN